MTNGIPGTVDRIYENFIMRDLTYVFSGSLVLMSILYISDVDLINCIEYISQNVIIFLLFISVSYVTGHITFTGVMFLKIFTKVEDVYAPHNDLKTLWKLQEKYGPNTIRRIERENYLDRLARTIGSATLISFFILFFHLIIKYLRINDIDIIKLDIIIISILALITYVCVKEDRRWFNKLRKNLVEFGCLNETKNQS